MDPRLLSSVSLDPRIPYLVDHRLPSEGGLPQHLHRQEQHLGGGLTLRGPASVPAASLVPYSAVAPPVAGSSLSSEQGLGLYGLESVVGSGSNAVPQPWAASAESNRLFGGVAVPPGYKLVPVEQQGYERAPALQTGYERAPAVQPGYEMAPALQQGYERVPALQQGYERTAALQQGYERVPASQQRYERAPAAQLGYERIHALQQGFERTPAIQQGYEAVPVVQQGYERAPAAQLGYERVHALQQGLERVPAVQQGYEGVPVVPQGYEKAPVVQQQRFEANPSEYLYPGAKPLANAALIAPGRRHAERMVASPRLRKMRLSPPRMPRLRSEPELSSARLHRRPAYRLVEEQGGELNPMYGRTRQDLGQMPSFERSRKRARISKNESTATAAAAAAAEGTKQVSSNRRRGWCSICQVYCGPFRFLKEHKAGKKHKAQLNKKKNDSQKTNKTSGNKVVEAHESTVDKTSLAAAVAATDNSKKRKSNREKAKVKELHEDIVSNGKQTVNKDETKPNTYEKCEVCNITCANRAILQAHFAGKKHAACIKKLLKKDGATKSNGNQITVVDGTDGDAQTADGDVKTGEEEKTEEQEATEETETLVAVEEPREKEE